MQRRRSKKLTRRALARTAAAAIVGTSMWPAAPARASLFGEENASLLAILAEMIEQVLNAVKTVEGVFETVNQLVTVVNQGATVLSHLKDVDSLVDLLNWAHGAISKLQAIDRDVKKLGYKFDAIDQQHEAVFPTRQSLETMPSKNFTTTARGWNDALRESTVVAMRAQTSVESLQARAEAQQKMLDSSKTADGVVAQLQAVVSGLSLLHSDLAVIETNLAAGMRVTAAWAAKQAAQTDLAEEDHKRMLEGYTNDDAPEAVLTELP
jgi:P-type conjugative transfer protein TrbJ